MNKVFLIGNLTKDPELASTNSGIKFCRFTLAVSRSYSKDGKRETDFLPVVVWRAQADNCARYLKKAAKRLSAAAFKQEAMTRKTVLVATSPKSLRTRCNSSPPEAMKTVPMTSISTISSPSTRIFHSNLRSI